METVANQVRHCQNCSSTAAAGTCVCHKQQLTNLIPGPLRESQKIVIEAPAKEDLARSSCGILPRASQKNFVQTPLIQGIFKIFMQGPQDILTRISARSWSRAAYQDHQKKISQGRQYTRNPQEHPRSAFRQTPLIHGIFVIFMQGPRRAFD